MAKKTKTVVIKARFSRAQERALLDILTGDVLGSSLPTADPLVPGVLWNNVGVVTVSDG